MQIPLLGELVVALGGASALVWGCHKLKLPSLFGFLFAGLLLGPAGLNLVHDIHAIEVMAEIGIVMLLFTIGLEISLNDLVKMAKPVFLGGGAQLLLTGLLAGAVAWGVGASTREAIFWGLLVGPSSTALVLRLLGDSGQLGSRYGRLSLAVLLMQDLAVVLLILLVPLLRADAQLDAMSLGKQLGLAFAVIVGIYTVARFAFPWLLHHVMATRSRELFLLASLLVALGTAHIAGMAGLSLALGAFIAGVVISESIYSHQIFTEVLPFRDLFTGLFFVSVGLLVSPQVVLDAPLKVAAAVLAVMLAKGLIVAVVARVAKLKWSEIALTAASLCQVGEFAFVLAQQGMQEQLLSDASRQLFLTVSVATMLMTPAVIGLARLLNARAKRAGEQDEPLPELPPDVDEGHVIIVGYGINGRNVARALRQLKVPHVIVEMNIATVSEEGKHGAPIIFGDATREALLTHLHVEQARALVVAIGEPTATRDIVANARRLAPKLLILARTRFVTELEPLYKLGADRVVPEEFETSLELTGQVLAAYGVTAHVIEQEKLHLRRAQYGALVSEQLGAGDVGHTLLELMATLDMEELVLHDGDAAVGRTLGELHLRNLTGAAVVAVLRQGVSWPNPRADFAFGPDDRLVLTGEGAQLRAAELLLRDGVAPAHGPPPREQQPPELDEGALASP